MGWYEEIRLDFNLLYLFLIFTWIKGIKWFPGYIYMFKEGNKRLKSAQVFYGGSKESMAIKSNGLIWKK